MENKSNRNLRTGLFSPFTAYTGVSKRTVCRVRTIERRFTRHDLKMFKQRKLTQQKMEEIGRIPDVKKRKRIVELIASGVDFEKAWKKVMREDIDLDTTTTKAEKEIKALAKREKAPELTEEDWLETNCGERIKLLGNAEGYEADALLYRETIEARAKFRLAVEAAMERRRAAGPVGFLWEAINRIISLAHPREWPVCAKCAGKGKAENGRTCKNCEGAGFELQYEK